MKIFAIVLAGGSGTRMHSAVPKQYMQLEGKPVLYYSLKAFQDSAVDEIILVAARKDWTFCREELIEKYHLSKVTTLTEGGRERYLSVQKGLEAIRAQEGIVLIHDGARPCLSQEVIQRNIRAMEQYQACVTAVPVKDTIKVADEQQMVVSTPDRSTLWQIQTPQTFHLSAIRSAYDNMAADMAANGDTAGKQQMVTITDDAMVMEQFGTYPVRLVQGDYCNLKITTPEDLGIAAIMVHKAVK